MVTDKLKQLEEQKAKIAELEKSIAEQLNKELAQLPGRYGFDSAQAFIRAVRAATGGGGGGGGRGAGGRGKRRTRAVITDETRANVKKMVNDGKTGAEIAKSLGISLPSVQNIKKALGLVQARKKK